MAIDAAIFSDRGSRAVTVCATAPTMISPSGAPWADEAAQDAAGIALHYGLPHHSRQILVVVLMVGGR